jgi:uncharacterized membrane protein
MIEFLQSIITSLVIFTIVYHFLSICTSVTLLIIFLIYLDRLARGTFLARDRRRTIDCFLISHLCVLTELVSLPLTTMRPLSSHIVCQTM